MIEWMNSTPTEFWQYSSRMTICKMGNFSHTDTKVRKSIISSHEDWDEFTEDCVLLRYDNESEWSFPNAKNYYLREYASKYPNHLEQRDDLLIISAFHNLLKRRLILDGTKRAIALQALRIKDQELPQASIIECSGNQLHAIFPCDFCNMIKDSLLSYLQNGTF